MTQPLKILIVGATGQQGTATISALHAIAAQKKRHSSSSTTDDGHPSPPPPPPIQILALTRSAHSPKARALLEKFPDATTPTTPSTTPTITTTLIEGAPQTPDPIFAAHPDITSIFLVTVPVPGDPSNEEAQAIPMIDAAVSHGTPHLVFSSVDRGGDVASWEDSTATDEVEVPHFASKHRVEVYLRDVAAAAAAAAKVGGDEEGEGEGEGEGDERGRGKGDGKGKGKNQGRSTTWTILRPTGFMDNYGAATPFSRMMAALWATMPPDRTMQLISVHDIGVFAARALLDYEDERWINRAVGLAGDELTLEEARAVFRRTLGEGRREMPQAWTVVGRAVRWAVAEAGASMRWFEQRGFGVDVGKLRREEPGLLDFGGWLRMRYGGGQGENL